MLPVPKTDLAQDWDPEQEPDPEQLGSGSASKWKAGCGFGCMHVKCSGSVTQAYFAYIE